MKLIKWSREYFTVLRQNFKLLVSCLLLIPAVVVLNNFLAARNYRYYGFPFCIGDSFLQLASGIVFPFTIVLLCLFFTFHLVQNDLREPVVLREHSKGIIWLKQVYKAVLCSFGFSLYTTLCAGAIGSQMISTAMNWGRESSAFFNAVGSTAPWVSLWQVAGGFLLSSFLLMTAYSLLILLLTWLTNRAIWGWMAYIALSIFDSFGIGAGHKPFFYGVFLPKYDSWAEPGKMLLSLLYPAVIILLLTAVGWAVVRRKDFLNVHQT